MNLNRATLLSDALKKDETGPCQAQPAKTIRRKKSLKKSLTLRSDALQKDDERPAQPPDCALQAAAEPGQKYGSMAASPYRQMKKGQRRPHGVGPKDPKHGFFGALPLRQRGRRIKIYFDKIIRLLHNIERGNSKCFWIRPIQNHEQLPGRSKKYIFGFLPGKKSTSFLPFGRVHVGANVRG